MFNKTRFFYVLLALIISFYFVACGGGGGSSSGGGTVTPTSNTVTGQLQASYINGASVCVDETIGTATENCSITAGQGNFTLQNALTKKLTVRVANVAIGSVSADKVNDGITITPAVLASDDATKAQKIAAIFHQAGYTKDYVTYDLSAIKSTDISQSTVNNYLTGTSTNMVIGQILIDHTTENTNISNPLSGTYAGKYYTNLSNNEPLLIKANIVQTGSEISGTYSAISTGDIGDINGTITGMRSNGIKDLNITFSQKTPGCPGTYSGTGNTSTIEMINFGFTGSDCRASVSKASGTVEKTDTFSGKWHPSMYLVGPSTYSYPSELKLVETNKGIYDCYLSLTNKDTRLSVRAEAKNVSLIMNNHTGKIVFNNVQGHYNSGSDHIVSITGDFIIGNSATHAFRVLDIKGTWEIGIDGKFISVPYTYWRD